MGDGYSGVPIELQRQQHVNTMSAMGLNGGSSSMAKTSTSGPSLLVSDAVVQSCANAKNRFLPTSEIAKGAFGRIYEACDRDSKQCSRVFKYVNAEDYDKERTILGFLKDKNIVPSLEDTWKCQNPDFGTISMQRYTTNLEKWLKDEQKRNPKDFYNVVTKATNKIIEMLYALTSKYSILHRDMKLDNILVLLDPTRAEPSFAITDFGLAQMYERGKPRFNENPAAVNWTGMLIPQPLLWPPTENDPWMKEFSSLYNPTLVFYYDLITFLQSLHIHLNFPVTELFDKLRILQNESLSKQLWKMNWR